MSEKEYRQQNPNRNRYGSDWAYHAKQARITAFQLKFDIPELLNYWDKVNPEKAERWRQKDKEFDFENLPASRDWDKLSDDEIYNFFMWVKEIRSDITKDELIEAKKFKMKA